MAHTSWDQLYLSEVRYADYGDPRRFLTQVKFFYEGSAGPIFRLPRRLQERTVRRCTRIDVFTEAGNRVLTRSYHFVYLDQRDLLPEQLPLNGVSLLSQIIVEGRDGGQNESLPPLEFDYTRFEPQRQRYQPFDAVNHDVPDRSLGHTEYELVDLYGNGLPDVIQLTGQLATGAIGAVTLTRRPDD